MHLNVANILPRSAVNGPGERFVVWVQGCTLGCPGCWNTETWSMAPRRLVSVETLADEIRQTANIEGITLTGGEPFEQAASLTRLCDQIRSEELSVMAFTGFRLSELVTKSQRALLERCDIVVAGRYVRTLRAEEQQWRGSTNQTVHYLTDRYAPPEAASVGCEVYIEADGRVVVSGFPPDELIVRPLA